MRVKSGGAPRALLQKHIRTVVVDDSPTALKAVCAVVARQGLTVVGTATNGCAALALARAVQPDLVLMDLEMPTMGGIEATSCLQQECRGTHVVIVTVDDNPELRRMCRQCGARGFIAKSALNEELPTVIRELFGNRKCG